MEKCVDVNRLYLFLQNRDKTGSLSSEWMDLYREKPYSQSMIKIQCCFNAISHYQVQEKENKKVQHILIGENGKIFPIGTPKKRGPSISGLPEIELQSAISASIAEVTWVTASECPGRCSLDLCFYRTNWI